MRTIPFIGLVVVVACAPPIDTAAEAERIRELDRNWVAAVAAGDTTAIGNIYTESGRLMPPNMLESQGRAAVRQAWAGMLALPGVQISFAPTEIHVADAGDVAFDIGTYSLAFDGPEGRVEDSGKYVVVWRKVAGEWQVEADIFNSNMPAQ